MGALEAWITAVCRVAQARCLGGMGRQNGLQRPRSVATRACQSRENCTPRRVLRLARPPSSGRYGAAQPAEPPDADPHVRWCGRGARVTAPPMPIGEAQENKEEDTRDRNHKLRTWTIRRS